MASLNLVTRDNRSHVFKHPALSFIGVSLCLGAIALTVQFIVSYQPIMDNANKIALQQSQQLENRKHKQHIYEKQRQAQVKRDDFLRRQQSVSDELNAFAGLLEKMTIEFGEASVKLSNSRLEVTSLYDRIAQTEALKNWLNAHWKNPEVASSLHQQLLPEKRVLLVLERSSS